MKSLHRCYSMFFLLCFLPFGMAHAAVPSVTNNLVALQGYDPVAYFTDKMPIKGVGINRFVYKGVAYIFADTRNLETFKQDPEKYIPAFGGFCAYAVMHGKKVVGDPQAWKIYDGKLYLNLNKRVLMVWEKDIANNIATANKHWPQIKDKPIE